MSADTIIPGIYQPEDFLYSDYKQSEIGMIPSDWSVFSIGDLFDYMHTASNARSDLDHTGTVSYVHYGDIHVRFNHFIDFNHDEIPRLSDNKSTTATRLCDGDLIVADASEDETGVGKSVEVRNLGAIEAISGLHTFLLRAKDERIHHGYRGYVLEKPSVKIQLRRLATGLKVFGISKQSLSDVRIPLPLPAEQRAIAETLSDVDGLLGALDALIAKKQAVKQVTMQQLLTGKTRLPGFREEWATRRLREIVSIRNQKIAPSDVDIDTLCIELDHIDQDNGRLTTYSKASYSTSTKYRFFVGDVLFGRLRSYLRKFWHADRDGICTTEIWPLVVNLEQLESGFLYFIVQMNRFIEAAGISYGTHMPRADWSVMQNFEIRLPTITEQRTIAAILYDMDAEIAALERRRDKIRTLRQGMMQQLLTGKIRLIESIETTIRRASATSAERKHNWQFNEAVVIAVLTKHFGDEKYPLSRTRYTKLSYLLHRHSEGRAEGYLKKAAGPYNPNTRYGGPENIALTNDYVCRHKNYKYSGFIAGKNIEQAESYFAKWYGKDCLKWLNQFRYKKRDDLELLTTVDLAIEELREAGKAISVEGVRKVIHSDPEWKAKLNRPVFSSTNITRTIEKCRKLFGVGDERPKT